MGVINNMDNPVSILWANKMKLAGGMESTKSSQKKGKKKKNATSTCNSSSKLSNNYNASPLSSSSWNNHIKKECVCSPTTHPGSFKCRYHRSVPISLDHLKPHQQNVTGLSRFARPAATTDHIDINPSESH